MKKSLLFLLFLIGSLNASSQKVNSSCSAPDSIIAKYRYDADWLTYNMIYRQKLPYKDSLYIPHKYSDPVLKALIAVYNATTLAVRDTVVEIYDIHTYPYGFINEIYISADSNLSWMKQLKIRKIPSGNTLLDSFIQKYSLHFIKYVEWAFGDYVVFKTDSNYNIDVLVNIFNKVPGVNHAGSSGLSCDGSDIHDSIYADHIELIYIYCWNGIDGCIGSIPYAFKVYFDCSVEYFGHVFYMTHIQNIDPEPVSPFPNPFNNSISLKGISTPFHYSISNMLGEVLITGYSINSRIDGLEILDTGVYTLLIKNEGQTGTYKIIHN